MSLWLGGEHGLYRVRLDALSGEINLHSPGAVLRFGPEEGLTPADFSFPGTRSLVAPDGRLWFASNHDVLIVDPSQVRINELAPPVSVQSISVNGRPLPLGPESDLTLQTRPKRVDLEFTGLALGNPNAQTFALSS